MYSKETYSSAITSEPHCYDSGGDTYFAMIERFSYPRQNASLPEVTDHFKITSAVCVNRYDINEENSRT
ncbi:hypothetical protein CW696_00495 [ANME-2 cluster archaeon]|nr:MAG: hypothetical protein CW696_00495 [ANME-2 cluster archaeon]